MFFLSATDPAMAEMKWGPFPQTEKGQNKIVEKIKQNLQA